jgi:hypothetical protein
MPVPGISREADLAAISGRGAMSLDFTAVDFETASSHPGSVCAVGLVRVRDGHVAGKSGGLVRPPDGLGEFADYQTSVHGITAEMVATGTLKTRTRQQAWNDVATVGAIPENDVTRRTNILVVGDLNPRFSPPEPLPRARPPTPSPCTPDFFA